MEDTLRIPKSKIGILIGQKGSTRRDLEKTFGVTLSIDEEGSVIVSSEDGFALWQATKAVKGIGRGFNIDAVKKLKKEDYDLIVINLESVVGHKSKDIERYKGRVIGQGGKTKKYIETATNTEICLSGKTVSIIGNSADAHHAKEAIGIIIDGAEIKTLYSYLYKVRKEQEESELLGI